MPRTTMLGLLAVPVAGGGLYWLMLHGHLDLVVWLLLVAVVAMVVASVRKQRRGHRRWAALLLAGAVAIVAIVGGYGWNLNRKIGNIDRADDGVLEQGERPPRRATKALNILVLGADNPTQLAEKPTISELLADGTWDQGAYRSDTIMVMHVPANRKGAYLVSIPRDSYVPIHDAEGEQHGSAKINEAFAAYGPYGTWRTVENLSGVRLDHMAIIDFVGFRDLTTAIDGVDVFIPEAITDPQQHVDWPQGWNHVEGNLALNYVRMRYGLENGDFDRIARQQNFMRAMMEKVLADETVGNPAKFTDTLAAITDNLTVDESWSNGQIRGLALGLRGLSSDKVRFVTLPLDHYERLPEAGYVNMIDAERVRELFDAFDDDALAAYLRKHPEDELPEPDEVS